VCRTSRDLAEQCIKVLELVCTREAGAIFEAGGLSSVLNFIRDSGTHIHKVSYFHTPEFQTDLCMDQIFIKTPNP
jgi:E3 ubiquitin-protein ligase HECTD1